MDYKTMNYKFSNSVRLQISTVLVLVVLSACASKAPEMKTVDYVDLDRFMGDWYVIANIPTFLEKGAHNAVENYQLNEDGTMARLPDLVAFAQMHNLKIGTIADLIAYRRRNDNLVKERAQREVTSVFGGDWVIANGPLMARFS